MPVVDLADVEGGGFEPIPSGVYHVLFTDYELRQTSDSSKHPDNDYYNLEFVVQSGEFEGRRLWTNMMLPPYQPFVLKQLVSAAGGDANAPIDVEEWLDANMGEAEFNARVKKKPATKDYDAGNEIKGFKPYDPSQLSTGGSSSGGGGFAP